MELAGARCGLRLPDLGLTIDNSTGTMLVETEHGTITGYNFDYFEDTRYDDTLIGSERSEIFYMKRGGFDTITGGAGEDTYNFKTNHDHYGYKIEGGSEIEYRYRVTDYEPGEEINLMMMGFDPVSFAEQVEVSYSAADDRTYISVDAGSFARSNFIALDGEYLVGEHTVSLVYDHGDPEKMVQIRLDAPVLDAGDRVQGTDTILNLGAERTLITESLGPLQLHP